jgi:hypothetical protein
MSNEETWKPYGKWIVINDGGRKKQPRAAILIPTQKWQVMVWLQGTALTCLSKNE